MTILAGIGGSTPLLTNPPPDKSEMVQPVDAVDRMKGGTEDPRQAPVAELQKPVLAAKYTDETSAAGNSDAVPLRDGNAPTSREDSALSIFDGPSIPLPVEEFLPAPKPEDDAADARETATLAVNAETTERIMDGVASTDDPLPKGEALNLLVPMPDGTETPQQTKQNET